MAGWEAPMPWWADWWGMRQDCFVSLEGGRRGRRGEPKMRTHAVENVLVANLPSSVSCV